MASVSESGGGIPTGQIVFQDGSTILGTVPLNATGTATPTLSTLTLGAHSVSATYAGDGTFGGSTSSVVNISITAQNADFALSATPPNATVMAGQSTQFVLTVAPSNGFTKSVTFSCPVIAGITCVFSPAAVTPTNGTASTTLTVATSADVTRYAIPLLRQIAPVIWLAALGLLVVAVWHGRKLQIARASLFATAWVLAMFSLSVALGGCGGYSNSGTSTNRGTASIIVTAQSGTLSHNTTVSVTVQ